MKTLHTVTLTGVDKHVQPHQLGEIAVEAKGLFNVEFGILFGNGNGDKFAVRGEAYHERALVGEFSLAARRDGFKLSAHLCGTWSRAFFLPDFPAKKGFRFGGFDRIQLNINFVKNPVPKQGWDNVWNNLRDIQERSGKVVTIILQLNRNNIQELRRLLESEHPILNHVSLLYDESGGRGVPAVDMESHKWVASVTNGTVLENTVHGYAGRFSAGNVRSRVTILDNIHRHMPVGRFCIDMENKLRDHLDRFDVEAAKAVVRNCAATMEDLYPTL